MVSLSVPSAPRIDLGKKQVVDACRQVASAAVGAHPLEDALSTVLDSCYALGYSYSALILLVERGDCLEGRLMLRKKPPEVLAKMWRATGREVGAVAYPIGRKDNSVVGAYYDHIPRITARLSDLLPPGVPLRQASLLQRRLRLDLSAVLPLVTGGQCLGVLLVGSTAGESDTTINLPTIGLLATVAALSIERAQLQKDLHDRDRQVSLLLKATIDAQEDERERICLDIHDGVAQTLAPAFQYLQTLYSRPELPDTLRTHVSKAGMLVRNAIREARDVIATLRPTALDTVGLVETLRFEIDELRTQAGWEARVEADQMRFPKTLETALYRILREALTNVTKHAHARHVVLRLWEAQDRVVAMVEDDGVGFDPGAEEQDFHRKGVGLLSMRKRTELLQGNFSVDSSPGRGTCVRVDVPMLTYADDYHLRAQPDAAGAYAMEILVRS